jgi:hypothetical protein
MITLRDEQTARKAAARLGLKLQRSGNLYALTDAETGSVLMGFNAYGKPAATIGQVLAWLEEGARSQRG